jgi:glycosyltransferase involved in cell wall biosynthesis
VASIVGQTSAATEILVLNYGSFRAEDAILEELADRYPVPVFAQPNSGLGSARNFGISQSRGDCVFPLDADDLAAATFLERCVEVLESDPEVAFVTSWSRFADEQGEPIEGPEAGYQPLGGGRALRAFNLAGPAEAVFRRELFERGLGYSIELTSYEDWMHFRLLVGGRPRRSCDPGAPALLPDPNRLDGADGSPAPPRPAARRDRRPPGRGTDAMDAEQLSREPQRLERANEELQRTRSLEAEVERLKASGAVSTAEAEHQRWIDELTSRSPSASAVSTS